jgi:hypothetical protein
MQNFKIVYIYHFQGDCFKLENLLEMSKGLKLEF